MCEDSNVLELVVVLTDMVEVCLPFAAVVAKLHDAEVKGVLGPAFGVNLAVGDDIREPGQFFIVMRHNELDA